MPNQFGWKRMLGLAVVFAGMFYFMVYMQIRNPPFVPGRGPRPPVDWSPFVGIAIITVVVVTLIDVVFIWLTLRRQKRIHEETPEVPGALVTGEVAPETVSPNRMVQAAVKRTTRKARKGAPRAAPAAEAPAATATMEAERPAAQRKPAKRKPAKKKPSSRKKKGK